MTHITPQTTPRYHQDGWTPEVQAIFLDALTTTGSVREAARVCGKAPASAYRLGAHVDGAGFKAGWAQALAVLMERVRETALDRAYNGRIMPVLHEGMQIGEELVFNDRLLIQLMRLYDAPAYHAERARAAELARLPASASVPMTQAELFARFEAAMAKARLGFAARDAMLAELAQGDDALPADSGDDLGVAKESPKADDERDLGVANESRKADDPADLGVSNESPKTDDTRDPGVSKESPKADTIADPNVANESPKISLQARRSHDVGARAPTVQDKCTTPARPKRRKRQYATRSNAHRRRSG